MRLKQQFLIGLLTCALLATSGTLAVPKAGSVHVDFKETKLKNGLRVITVEDHSAPVIALDITYNVGSRNERQGRTGFAHLFEHMMFKGSENVGTGSISKPTGCAASSSTRRIWTTSATPFRKSVVWASTISLTARAAKSSSI